MRFTAVREFSHDGKLYKAGKTYVGDESYATAFVTLGDATTDGGDSETAESWFFQPSETDVKKVGDVDGDKDDAEKSARERLADEGSFKGGAKGGGDDSGAPEVEAAEKASSDRLGRDGTDAVSKTEARQAEVAEAAEAAEFAAEVERDRARKVAERDVAVVGEADDVPLEAKTSVEIADNPFAVSEPVVVPVGPPREAAEVNKLNAEASADPGDKVNEKPASKPVQPEVKSGDKRADR